MPKIDREDASRARGNNSPFCFILAYYTTICLLAYMKIPYFLQNMPFGIQKNPISRDKFIKATLAV
jgi:hypothetical protein